VRIRTKFAGAVALSLLATSMLVLSDTSVPEASATAPVPANTLALTPPMGWNSWNKFNCDINEAKIKSAADGLVSSGMAAAGYKYVNIDDCWAERDRDGSGNLVPHKTKFPNGVKAVVDYIHGLGLKAGIYSSAGDRTCTGPSWWVGPQPGSIGSEQKDADLWASWGIDYLKYDNCGNHWGRSAKQRYEDMGRALRNTGRDIVYSICNWGEESPWEFGPTVGGNLWRTTGDISDNWSSVVSLFDQQRALEPFAKVGAWNDPDMLEVGNGGMTDTEYRSHFSMWAMLNAPLVAGNDLSAVSPATKAILTNADVIAVDQDWGGSQGRLLDDFGNGTEVWGKPMSDGSAVAMLFNRGGGTATITTSAAELGLGGSSSYRVKDLWSKAESTTAHTISASVPGHGVALFRVTRDGAAAAAPVAGSHLVGDLPWSHSSNGWGPAERNMSNGEKGVGDGRTLTLAGRTYAKGIGTHAYSSVHVYLGKACYWFQATVGIDDESSRGAARFQVYGDGVLLAYTDVLRGGSAVSLGVPTKGYRTLELRTTDGRDGWDYDHTDWADARIDCATPSSGVSVSERATTSSANGWGPIERDLSNGESVARDGTVITVGGVRYRQGLGVHAPSTVVIPLNGTCHGFDATVGLDAEATSQGSVIFEVVADGTTVYTSPVLRSGQSAPVAVRLTGTTTMSLVVRDAGDGNGNDHADWAGARLSCD